MIVLGVDTSTARLSVALVDDKKILAASRSTSILKHSSLLMPSIESVLKRGGLSLKDVDLFAVGLGPGSFTGLRVGVTAVRALAIAAGKPVIGVPSLDAVARNARLPKDKNETEKYKGAKDSFLVCPVLDARQQQVYACMYKVVGGEIEGASSYLLEGVERLCGRIKSPVIFLGDGLRLYRDYLSKHVGEAVFQESDNWQPKGHVIARLAAERYRRGQRDDAKDLNPMYLYSRECHIRR